MLLRISIRYLLAHQRQTMICVAGVVIAVMVFLAMDSMMRGFSDKFIIETVESSGHVTVNDEPRESLTPILEKSYPDPNALLVLEHSKPRTRVKQIKNPTGLIRKLRALPGIMAVAPEVTGTAILTYGNKTINVDLLGVEPEEQQKVTTIGDKLLSGDFSRLRTTADGVVLGRGVALVLGAKLGDSIVLTSTKRDGSPGGRTISRVVGIFETGVVPVDYSRAYMLINSAQTLLDKKNIVNRLTLRTDDYEKARGYARQIESICGYKTESWQESNENFLKIFQIQNMITGIITTALITVAAFGVLNILIMAVLERINDIAILRSFGFTRGDITIIFLIQGLIIGVVGALLGLICGKLMIVALKSIPVSVEGLVRSEHLLMSEHNDMYVSAFISAMIAVALASVYPARRAAKYDPVEVIRGAH